MLRSFTLALVALVVVACASTAPQPMTSTQKPTLILRDYRGQVKAGADFLRAMYRPERGLLQESPSIGNHNYFLANDALLAVRAADLYGDKELADNLRTTLQKYRVDSNDFIEVAWGKTISWPPKHFEDPGSLVEQQGDDRILTIRHDGPGYFYDWSAYSNLAFMAAINELNRGNKEAARRLYEIEMGTFDGRGFPDKAFHDRNGVYETLGLAWGAYAAGKLCLEPPTTLLEALHAQQAPVTGGFHTHYRPDADRLADPNIETTSVALLALQALQKPECWGN